VEKKWEYEKQKNVKNHRERDRRDLLMKKLRLPLPARIIIGSGKWVERAGDRACLEHRSERHF
jgi:hypothetical protein